MGTQGPSAESVTARAKGREISRTRRTLTGPNEQNRLNEGRAVPPSTDSYVETHITPLYYHRRRGFPEVQDGHGLLHGQQVGTCKRASSLLLQGLAAVSSK